jgi:hypothetical protein
VRRDRRDLVLDFERPGEQRMRVHEVLPPRVPLFIRRHANARSPFRIRAFAKLRVLSIRNR